MTPRIRTVRDEKGVALPLALFALVMLSGLLLTFLSMSATETLIAQNHVSASRAFHIADAGIEHAFALFPTTNIPTDPKVLQSGWTLLAAQAFDNGSYTVTLSQNAAQLAAGTYLLTSTATLGNASRQITALVAGGPPAPRGSAESLVNPLTCSPVGQPSCTEFDAEGNTSGAFDGRDWIAPANGDIAGCTSIASCGTKIGDNVGTYGAFANSNSNTVQIAPGGSIEGKNCAAPCGTSPATASVEKDATVALTRWDKFIDQAELTAKPHAASGGFSGGGTGCSGGTCTWGTAAAPEIHVINHTGSNFAWNAVVKGAGVLIIETPGVGPGGKEVEIRGTGSLYWEGLVIVRSPGRVSFEIGCEGCAGSPTARIFGQLVNRSALYAEIEFENNRSFIKYSSQAMRMVRGQFSTFRGWQEVTTAATP